MKLRLSKKYMILQGLFWMLFCVANGFISLCLQSRGLNNQSIGIVTAIFGTVSALLQPVLGRLCDKCALLTWKKMILVLIAPFLMICILMPFIHSSFLGTILVGLLILLSNTMIPFINSAHSSYEFHGQSINFGLARGIGSATYALLAVLIGNLAARFGTNVISYFGVILSLVFILVVCSMPYMEYRKLNTVKETKKQAGFIKRYPAFMIMYLSFIFLFTSANLIGIYLLQIIQSFGGTSKEFGVAIAIQAIVEVPVLFTFSLLLKKAKPNTWMLIAALGYVVKAVGYALAGSITTIYLVQFTQMISFALFASASVYYTLEVIKREDQITGQSLMTSILAIGTVIGSLMGGWILDNYGVRWLFRTNVLFSVIGILLAGVSYYM